MIIEYFCVYEGLILSGLGEIGGDFLFGFLVLGVGLWFKFGRLEFCFGFFICND